MNLSPSTIEHVKRFTQIHEQMFAMSPQAFDEYEKFVKFMFVKAREFREISAADMASDRDAETESVRCRPKPGNHAK